MWLPHSMASPCNIPNGYASLTRPRLLAPFLGMDDPSGLSNYESTEGSSIVEFYFHF